MAEVKTKPTKASAAAFIDAVSDEERRADAKVVLKLMREVTGEKPVVWGESIVGFGAYRAASGDWPLVGFSPRKANLVVYLMPGFAAYEALLGRLGKHKTGKSCLYLNRLKDVDMDVLRELVRESYAAMKAKHGAS